MIRDCHVCVGLGMIIDVRRSPYPPNFRSRPARNIEPARGASTWAFGSHRWREYIGIFTKKAVDIINHRRVRGRCVGGEG